MYYFHNQHAFWLVNIIIIITLLSSITLRSTEALKHSYRLSLPNRNQCSRKLPWPPPILYFSLVIQNRHHFDQRQFKIIILVSGHYKCHHLLSSPAINFSLAFSYTPFLLRDSVSGKKKPSDVIFKKPH